MVKHIVMWRFRPGEEARADEFLRRLAALQGVIPELLGSTVRRNEGGGDWYAVLTADFASFEALERYKNDPRHKEVSALCKAIRTDRAAVDYTY